jgi:hypothetical protein
MKPCIGCKHLHVNRLGAAYCQEHWAGFDHVLDQYTGTFHLESRSKYQTGRAWPMRVQKMREAGGPCGPEAKLFAPSLLVRFENWIASVFRRNAATPKLK